MQIATRVSAALILASLVAGPLSAATTQPAGPRATALPATTTAPRASADYSTPKHSVASFLQAIQSTDAAAIHRVLAIAPDQRKAVDAYVNLIFATNKLVKAAEEKFPDQADQYFGTNTKQLESRLKAIEGAPVKMVGDSAILELPADEANHQQGGSIVLKKVGSDWKIDATTLFKLNDVPKEEQERNVTLAQKMTTVTDQMTKEVEQGKFGSAAEAYQEFWNRSLESAKGEMAKTSPSTAPATSAPAGK